jgi:hypothetical protein
MESVFVVRHAHGSVNLIWINTLEQHSLFIF